MANYPAIDPFYSEGIEINLDITNDGLVSNATPRKGYVNQLELFDSSINEQCSIFNCTNRINSPMLRKNGKLEAVSISEAIVAIKTATNAVEPNQNAIFASAKHTNEMMYLIQKWCRKALNTDTISSFEYINTNPIINLNKNDNVPMHELIGSKHICIFASELNIEHPIIDKLLQYIRNEVGTQITFITSNKQSQWIANADNLITVDDYLNFVKAVNHHILLSGKDSGVFVNGLSIGFDDYKESALAEDYQALLASAGVSDDTVKSFAKVFISVPETVIIISEKSCDTSCFAQIKNLMLLTEKQGKPSAGMMFLKSNCNSQGIFDMGILPGFGPGFRKTTGDYANLLKSAWEMTCMPTFEGNIYDTLQNGQFKNLFIFGENPVKTNAELRQGIQKAGFICAQSCFENETTAIANLVLPMNFAIEIGGSFTSSFKNAQNFKAIRPCPFNWNDYQFMASLHEAYGLPRIEKPMDIFLETAQFFETSCCGGGIRHHFEKV